MAPPSDAILGAGPSIVPKIPTGVPGAPAAQQSQQQQIMQTVGLEAGNFLLLICGVKYPNIICK